MAKIGARYPVWAPVLSCVDGSAVTYQNPIVADKLISANITWDRTADALRADDKIAESYNGVNGGKIATNISNLSTAQRISMLGLTAISDGYKVTDAPTPYGGFGFITKNTVDGVDSYSGHWLYKVQFALNSEEAKTKGTGIEYGTPTIEGTIMPVYQDGTGVPEYEEVITKTLYADVKAWLDGKAGIANAASAGLSALSMTGTGGTLSPSFGASVRYYTYGGMSGTSFTVTPTAASHTIEMYVDDVFVQNITSGAASGAVTIALGSKKVKLVAYESGKAAQTTEIVVVKTS